MKIIGKTNGGFILESDENEIYNLIGFYYRGSERAPQLIIGSEIAASEMFHYLYTLGDGREKIKAAADHLRQLAERVELVMPLIPEKIQEVKPS